MRIVAAACALGLLQMWCVASHASDIQMTLDSPKSYANEAKHFAHVALIAKLDWSQIPTATRAKAITQFNTQIHRKSCAVLRNSGKVFAYVKNPNGVLESELRDSRGNLITVTRVRWTSC